MRNQLLFYGNGNVDLLVNAVQGAESARYAYSPFGETLRATGEMAQKNPIRFSTQFTDDVTGDAKYLLIPCATPLGVVDSRTLYPG